MKVSLPSSTESVVDAQAKATTSWFTYFQDVWKAVRGSLGIAIGGTLSVETGSTANSGSGETNLMSYTAGKNLLNTSGDELYVKAWGTFAANGNNKTVKLKFGSQTILTTGAVAVNSGSWTIEANIIRTGSNTQEIIATLLCGNTSITPVITRTAGTQDLTASNILVVTGQGSSSNDILQKAMIVKITPNN